MEKIGIVISECFIKFNIVIVTFEKDVEVRKCHKVLYISSTVIVSSLEGIGTEPFSVIVLKSEKLTSLLNKFNGVLFR